MSSTRSRTVNDYGTTRALRKALKPVDEEKEHSDDDAEELNESWDWVLTNYDSGTTVPQSLSHELHRLQVLKSYLVLDEDREEAFERLTTMAGRIFSVPIALVSLVDLGRQWFLSNRGLGDVRETPRNLAFCAHCIQGINDVFIVNDTLEDSRFCDSPLVQGAPFIRFYAGAPLLSPEGYKLGTFCIIDSKPRPNGLSEDDKSNLKDFAAMAMKCMVDRRNITSQDDTAHVVACTAHDLLTPLMGVQLSLELLAEDHTLSEANRESVHNAVRSSECLHRICETTMETLRDNTAANDSAKTTTKVCPQLNMNNSNADGTIPPCTCERPHKTHGSGGGAFCATQQSPLIDVKEFVDSLNKTMKSIPKRVPLILTVDQTVPARIVSDDLKLFRSSLNLLSNAFANTATGSVQFNIRASSSGNEQPFLAFECTDSGIDLSIEQEDEECLFKPCRKTLGVVKDLGLFSVAYQVDSLGGSYGYRARAKTEGRSGSVFWFQIPIVLPEDVSLAGTGVVTLTGADSDVDGSQTLDSSVVRFPAAIHHAPSSGNIRRSNSREVTPDQQAARSAGILAVAAAAATSTAKPGSNSCCGLDELAKFDNIEAYKEYQRRNRSNAPSTQSLLDHTATTKASSTDPCFEDACANKSGSAVAALWNSVQSKLRIDADAKAATPEQKPLFETGKGLVNTSESVPRTILISKGESKVAPGDTEKGVQSRPSQPNTPRQKKALVIEDTLVVRKTLTRALQKRGYEVTQAKDGLEGLEALKSTVFDITLCDFLMPNMDGLDCVSAYRQWEQVNRPILQYIVGISAHVSQKDVDKGLEIGMNDFRPKPITIKTLQELDESDAMEKVRLVLSKMEDGNECPAEPDQPVPASCQAPTTPENCVTTQQKSCLMATTRSDAASGVTAEKMRKAGWDVTIVQDGITALDSLKSRNWGAVVLDDDLPNLPGSQCVEQFRVWESQNRVNRQDNLFIVCTDVLLSNPDTCMLPPAGFDGAVDQQVSWSQLQSLISRHSNESVMRDGLSIVTR